MKPLTERQKQWMWFLILWCTGMLATVSLSYMVRGIVIFF